MTVNNGEKTMPPAQGHGQLTTEETPRCTLCGEPMEPAEAMFKYHGSLGPCPKPPLSKLPTDQVLANNVYAAVNSLNEALKKAAHAGLHIEGEFKRDANIDSNLCGGEKDRACPQLWASAKVHRVTRL